MASRFIALLVLTPMLLPLTGCAMVPMSLPMTTWISPYEDPYPNIMITDPSNVQGCKLLGRVSSRTRNYVIMDDVAQKSRIKDLKIEANKLGGTHIVASAPLLQDYASTITGDVYNCPKIPPKVF